MNLAQSIQNKEGHEIGSINLNKKIVQAHRDVKHQPKPTKFLLLDKNGPEMYNFTQLIDNMTCHVYQVIYNQS